MTAIAVAVFFALTPLVGLYGTLGIAYNPRKWRKYLPFLVLTVFMLSYTYNPTSEMDLTRYFESARECAKINSLKEFLEYQGDGLIVRTFIFWCVGKLDDVHLLPAISTAIVYGVSGYITCDIACEHKAVKWLPLLVLFQLLMLPYMSLVSNVRNVCAFSLIALAVYFDIVKEKRSIGVILLYILPCFVHLSAVLLVIARLLLWVIKKYKMIAICAAFFISPIINWAYENIQLFTMGGSMGDILRASILRAYSYSDNVLSEYERAVQTGKYANMQKLFMMAFALYILLLALYYFKYICKDRRWARFATFCFLICIMVLACNIFVAPNYWRFYCVVVITCPVILVPLMIGCRGQPALIQILMYALPVFMLGGLLMNFWNFRFSIDWEDWFLGFLLNSPYTILFKAVKALWGAI